MRKYIVYTLFIFSAAYGIHFHFLSGDNEPQTVAGETSQVQKSEVNLTQAEVKKVNRKDYRWGGNPFKSFKASKRASLGLTGISFNDNGPSYAVVNKRVVQTGDEIAGWIVTSIRPGYVLLTKKGVVEKLALGGEF